MTIQIFVAEELILTFKDFILQVDFYEESNIVTN